MRAMTEEIRRRWLTRLGRPAELDHTFFAVEEVYPRGAGVTVVAGELGTGTVRAGDALEAVGIAPAPFPVRVARVERPIPERRAVEPVEAGAAGEVLGLTLEHAADVRIEAGQCLAPAGRLRLASRVSGDVWVLPPEDLPGSPYEHRLLLAAAAESRDVEAFFHTRAVGARVVTPWRPELGHEYEIALDLDLPVALYPGARFALRYEGLTFAAGFIHEGSSS